MEMTELLEIVRKNPLAVEAPKSGPLYDWQDEDAPINEAKLRFADIVIKRKKEGLTKEETEEFLALRDLFEV